VKRLSYFILPLLFMPNIGLGRQTVFGFLELSDFVIWPYLAVTGLAVLRHGAKRPATEVGRRLFPWVMFFLAWSLAATLTITSRYSYFTDFEMQVGLLKLAKLFVYGLAGWLTLALARRVGEGRSLLWSLVASGLVVAASLMASASGVDRGSYNTKMGYEATNSISVEAAILIVFLGGAWAMGWGSRRWRQVAPWALSGMVLGVTFSQGRGGWLAAALGLMWFFYRKGLQRRTVVVTGIVMAMIGLAYVSVPIFKKDVDRTLDPDPRLLNKYDSGWMGIDAGSRPAIWQNEGRKLIDAPVLGRGFFNRFRGSGLHEDGSHNFWLQMFLETGVPGGLSVLAVLWILFLSARRSRMLPTEAALVAAFVGGLGGEYFYGGMPLFALIAVCAPIWLAEDACFNPQHSRTSKLQQPSRVRTRNTVVGTA
jgi:O-antigen ligase